MLLASQLLNAAQLAWDAPSDSTVTGYRMYRSLGTGAFTAVGTVNVPTTTFTTTFDTNQVSRYYVVSFNSLNVESVASNIVTNTPSVTPPPALVLSAPTLNLANVLIGQTISGTSKFTNTTGAPLVIAAGTSVITGRQPGASNSSGPFDDWSPAIPAQTVPIGGIVTLNASWVVRSDAPLGVWNAHLALKVGTNPYIDGPNTPFSVVSSLPSNVYYTFEAENGVIVSPMVKTADALASGGQFVQSSTTDTGTATYSVNVQYNGNYQVWCRVVFADGATDSFYVTIDGGLEDIFGGVSNVVYSPNWQWIQLNAGNGSTVLRIFSLTAGTHTLAFRGREINTKLDKFIVTNDMNYNPNVGTPTAPNAPTNIRTTSVVP